MDYIKTYELHNYDALEFMKLVINLKQNCHPYIRDLKKWNKGRLITKGRSFLDTIPPFMLWRGVKKPDFKAGELSKLKMIRKDRQPLDMPLELQKRIDDEFEDKFGVRLRSEGLFTSFDQDQADRYGNDYLVFPIGNYDVYWSDIIDLWDYISTDFEDIHLETGLPLTKLVDQGMIEHLVDQYHKGGLELFLDKEQRNIPQHEITIICESNSYYLVKSDQFKLIEALLV